MADYCGFLALDEAREARDRLAAQGIRAEIAIREAPAAGGEGGEEYWLRVDASRYALVPEILGFDAEEGQESVEADPGEGAVTGRFRSRLIQPARVTEDDPRGGPFECSECGQHVAGDEPFCPSCGLRFEDG
jgi:hypothetical protein